MGSKAFILSLAVLGLAAQPAWAEVTVGEVMQKGGVKLSREELKALLPGATYSGFNNSGGQFSINLQSGGTLSGTGTSGRGQAGLKGKWHIGDDGKWCFEILNLGNRKTESSCVFVFKSAGEYFVSATDTPGAGVLMRNIRK